MYPDFIKSFGGCTFRWIVDTYKSNPVYGADTASLAGFSRVFGIPYRTAQNWYSGERKPPEYLLKLLVYVLEGDGCNINYII